MQNIEQAMKKYCDFMREIRYRMNVISTTLDKLDNGESLTGYRESDIELIYLQFRHCLELIMFASLVAHYSHGIELSSRIMNKEYNASKILKFIRGKNAKFYPRPMHPEEMKDAEGRWAPKELETGYLTEQDFCKLYDQSCGRMLHAQRKPKFNNDHDKLISEAIEYRNLLKSLLNNHWVNITNKHVLRIIMKDKKTGDVSANYLKLISEKRR